MITERLLRIALLGSSWVLYLLLALSVLSGIDSDLAQLLTTDPNLFTFSTADDGLAEVRDFQTTGVVAFAHGAPFRTLKPGLYEIAGKETRVNPDQLEAAITAIHTLVSRL